MSTESNPPGRRIRPLPSIPITPSASTSVFIPDKTLLNAPPHNRSRESLVTIASTNTTQTVLPAYSSTLDLAVVDHEVTFLTDDLSGLNFEPPRYSYILSPAAENPMYTDSTPPQTFTVGGGNGESSRAQNSNQQRSNFVQHRLYLKKNSEKTWATLRLVSRVPLPDAKSKAPRFIGGDSVRGTLEVELDSAMSVRSLTLNVKGKMMTTRYVEGSAFQNRDCVILDYPHVLYSKKTHGEPGQFGQCTRSRNRKPDGKMHGTYHFPFSFTFPTEAAMGGGQNGTPTVTYELPPSFLEKDSGVTIKYEIGLTVDHGKLKMDSKVNTNIIYMPKVVAPPASQARRTAYEEGTVLPGPRNDPNGWHAVPPVTLSGIFRDREAQISCDLWLAKPLCYTRGTVLPCYLAISGVDYELLDHLSSPKSIHVQLSRYVYFCSDKEWGSNVPRRGSAREEEVDDVGTAVWWRPPKSDQPEDYKTRWLEGEIHLSRSLQPSCNYPLFIIEYSVEIMTFLADSFTINGQDDDRYPIVRQPVEIATFHQYGPVPRAFTAKDEKRLKPRRRVRVGEEEDKGGLMKKFSGPLKDAAYGN